MKAKLGFYGPMMILRRKNIDKINTERLYEYRKTPGGQLYGTPAYAPNACIFRLRALKAGQVCIAKSGEGTLNIYVTLTGEKVEMVSKDNMCKLDGEDAQWFKI